MRRTSELTTHESRGREHAHQVLERIGAFHTAADGSLHRLGIEVEADDAVASRCESLGHVGPHLPETDHAQIDVVLLRHSVTPSSRSELRR